MMSVCRLPASPFGKGGSRGIFRMIRSPKSPLTPLFPRGEPGIRKESTVSQRGGWVWNAARVLPILALVSLGGCTSGTEGNAAASPGARPEAVPVRAATAAAADVPVQIRVIGNVEPFSTVSIKPQVEGQLGQVHFREGQEVRIGDLLFTVDPRPFEAALRQAEANLARDLAESDNATVEAERRAKLLVQGFVSRDEHDQAQARAASLQAQVKANRAAIENAKLQLQYCSIRSPIDGRVGQILVHEGNVVKENETTLAIINQVRPVYVAFAVPEQELPAVRSHAAGKPLTVQAFIPPDGTQAIDGTLSFIDNAVDKTTGTVLMKGLFTNQDEALWPGQFIEVALTLAVQRGAIVIPTESIQTGQQGQFVFVVQPDGTVATRPVVGGRSSGGLTVVEQGLQAGDQVVTEGQLRLVPGTKVQISDAAGDEPVARMQPQ